MCLKDRELSSFVWKKCHNSLVSISATPPYFHLPTLRFHFCALCTCGGEGTDVWWRCLMLPGTALSNLWLDATTVFERAWANLGYVVEHWGTSVTSLSGTVMYVSVLANQILAEAIYITLISLRSHWKVRDSLHSFPPASSRRWHFWQGWMGIPCVRSKACLISNNDFRSAAQPDPS